MSPEGKVFFIGYILISTAIVPVIAVLIMNKFGVISEWSMNKRRDRTIPQIFTILVYSFVSYLLVFQIKVAEVLALAMIITTFSVFIITMITFFWKISAHSAGISGIVGILAALQYKYPADNGLYFLLSSIILTGSVMTARMYLHVHTPLQVLLGFLLGLSLSFFSVYFFI
jgi:membrane-associated phospholipid phosphatase